MADAAVVWPMVRLVTLPRVVSYTITIGLYEIECAAAVEVYIDRRLEHGTDDGMHEIATFYTGHISYCTVILLTVGFNVTLELRSLLFFGSVVCDI